MPDDLNVPARQGAMHIIHTGPDISKPLIQVFKNVGSIFFFLKLCSIQLRTTDLEDALWLLDHLRECISFVLRKIHVVQRVNVVLTCHHLGAWRIHSEILQNLENVSGSAGD